MQTYQVRLAPRPGTNGGNLTTEVRANSEAEARLLAGAQYPGYQVEATRRVN
jgi:hypothetical protein